jgi:hypothetical protein
MKTYTAVTYSSGSLPIGEFPTDNDAQTWAEQRFGSDLVTVIGAAQLSTSAVAVDPIWFAVGLTGLLLMFAWGSRRKKRGR